MFLLLLLVFVATSHGGNVMQNFQHTRLEYYKLFIRTNSASCAINNASHVQTITINSTADVLWEDSYYSTNDYGTNPTPTLDSDLIACKNNCSSNPNCNYVAFENSTNTCTLLSQCKLEPAVTGSTFYVKKYHLGQQLNKYDLVIYGITTDDCVGTGVDPSLSVDLGKTPSYKQCFDIMRQADLDTTDRLFWISGTTCNVYNSSCPSTGITGERIYHYFAFNPKITFIPSVSPTLSPTEFPTNPTKAPTPEPTEVPTKNPTPSPTKLPTKYPTVSPVVVPTNSPSLTESPTPHPTTKPSQPTTSYPSQSPVKPPTNYKVSSQKEGSRLTTINLGVSSLYGCILAAVLVYFFLM